MSLRSRRTSTALGLLTGAGVALTVLAAAPASAATAPDWPASRLPTGTGCAITAYTPFTATTSGLNEYTFTDTQLPVVTGWTANNRATSLALPPGATLVTFRIAATQTCGGVGSVTSGLVIGATRVSDSFPFQRDSTDAFRSVWAAATSLGPSDAGAYRMPTVNVAARYSSLVLTDTWSLVTTTPFAGSATTVTGPWSTQVLYVQRATTQTTSASRSTVAKGGKVTFRTVLRKAGPTAYVPSAGSAVALQTRVPGGAWLTRVRLTTNTSGVAAYTFAPSRTMSWRWVHVGTRSGAFTAPSTSASRTIKVV